MAVNIDKMEKAGTILNYLIDCSNKLYLLFLKYILPTISKLNRLFQSEQPKVYSLNKHMLILVKSLLENFIKSLYLPI